MADSAVLPELLHGEETQVWKDGAYQGQREIILQHAPRARDCTQRRCRYKDRVDEVERAKNRRTGASLGCAAGSSTCSES